MPSNYPAVDRRKRPDPEILGFPEDAPADLSGEKLRQWGRQHAFLNALAKGGTVAHAANSAGVTPWQVRVWRRENIHGFVERERHAAETLADNVERKIFSNVLGPKPDRIWMLATLKAIRRDKWGDQLNLHDDRAIEILDRLIALPAAGQGALPAPTSRGYVDSIQEHDGRPADN